MGKKGVSSLNPNWPDPSPKQLEKKKTLTGLNMEICGAALKGKEARCTRKAGWGTPHLGSGACKFHGGASPMHARANALPQLQLLVGQSVKIDPLNALLMCVRIAAAETMYYSQRIGLLEESELLQETFWGKQLNIWIKERQKATDRLSRYCKMALDAGVAERQVSIAEQLGGQLAKLLGSILGDLDLTPDQQVIAAEVVPRHLYSIQGGLGL